MIRARRLVVILSCLTAGLAMVPMLAGGVVLASTSFGNPSGGWFDLGPDPSAEAMGDIPAAALTAYHRAALACGGLSWTVLAGIGKVESDHGRFAGSRLDPLTLQVRPAIVGVALDGRAGVAAVPAPRGGSRWHGDTRWDHAVGPMQFLTGTWAAWGTDGNGDGQADPHNLADASVTAARYLCGGSPVLADVDAAVLRYNHSAAYVSDVLGWAARYAGPSPTGANAFAAGVVLPAAAGLDIAGGRVDPRVVSLLAAMGRSHRIEVSVLVSGHAQCVGGGDRTTRPGCAISNHWEGRAMDIAAVDGLPVSPANLAARRLLEQLLALPDTARPSEIGGPWGDLPGVFTDEDHLDHLHVGWDR